RPRARPPATVHERPQPPPVEVIPTHGLRCFCLDGFVTGGARFQADATLAHKKHIIGRLDGIEIVDITPDALEDSLECYAALVAKLFLFPQLAMETVEFVEDDLMG